MKVNKSLLVAALSLFAASGLMAKQQAKDEVPGVAAQPASYFYTGKPYDADLGAYTFNYRNYDPTLKRWTTIDPSGFPDGANNSVYGCNTPTTSIDYLGFFTVTVPERTAKICWAWWNDTGDSVCASGALSEAVTEMQNSNQGYYTNNLSAQLKFAYSTAGIADLLGSYTTVILFCHGFIQGNDSHPIYTIGNSHDVGASVSPLAAFGSIANAYKIEYATCCNAYSPNSTTGATGDEMGFTLANWAKAYTKAYLKE